MTFRKNCGFFSITFCILGLLLFYVSSLSENGILGIYFYVGALFWIISIYFGISGIRSKQTGISKYLGLLIILLILVIYGSMIAVMGIRGFGAYRLHVILVF